MRTGLLVVVCSTLAGLPAGVTWRLLAPLSLVERRADGLYRAGGEGDESAVAADGWFAAVTLVAGIVVALIAYLRTQPGRVGPLVALVVGGVLGGVVAWQVGHLLGPSDLESTAAGLRVGARFHGPLDVTAYGVLLAWPMATVITYFAVAAGAEAGERDERGPAMPGEPAHSGSVSPGAGERSEPR